MNSTLYIERQPSVLTLLCFQQTDKHFLAFFLEHGLILISANLKTKQQSGCHILQRFYKIQRQYFLILSLLPVYVVLSLSEPRLQIKLKSLWSKVIAWSLLLLYSYGYINNVVKTVVLIVNNELYAKASVIVQCSFILHTFLHVKSKL